ncbi:uncharacterized protein LOC111308254 [Durio zibethinus]|uniref:Uncharacterized protein LOC111308254 n=1 Tax=Durio zibethinus TaxID=66656 RepID=A0A6P6ABS5_DURZI|nr:uncharacterized protein LOC111308254 [Durio zibethinus]
MKWLVLTFFVLFVLFIYLSFPGFYLKNGAPIIQIESITPSKIASFNNNTIFTDWLLAFSLENPNKYVSIRYKKIQVSASDRDKRLSSGNVDYFYQDKREVGRMNVEILGLVFNLEEKINEAGEMVFTLKLDAVVWLEKKYMKNHWQLLEANCGDVRIRPSMSLTLDGSAYFESCLKPSREMGNKEGKRGSLVEH